MSGAIGNLGGVIGGNLVGGFGVPLENLAQSSLTSALGIGFRPTTSMLQALPDIAPDWMWTADIVNIPSLPGVSNMYVLDIAFSQNTIDTKNVYRNGLYQTFPSHSQAQHCTLQFYEPSNYNMLDFFYRWKSLIRDPETGYWGLPADYMGCIIVTLFDTVGIPQMAMRLNGIWPYAVQGFNLQYGSSNKFATNVDFSVNDCIVTYSSAGFMAGIFSDVTDFIGGVTGLSSSDGINSIF